MKILGISAGRHGGNSDIAVKLALQAAQEKGAECIFINLFDYNILHCTGCERCTMLMGDVAQGKRDDYPGCALKDKDDMDKIMNVLQNCNGVIIGCPTYDLLPSSLYLKFAQRFLAYELAFRLKIGQVKENPNLVGGLIAVGGSCHDWQGLSLESLSATMFTNSIKVVDQYMVTRVGQPGNIVLRPESMDRVRKMGENIVEAIQTPVEERHWMGDPDLGLCPNCHGGLVFKGDVHWDGIKFPYECAVCGAGLDLKDGKFELVEDGLCRDRNVDECRGYHLDEIMATKIDFFETQAKDPSVKEKLKELRAISFPAI
ncbi:MAG: flavodoxin family protein [Parasporobacterium sp.]|nr:flavodoxin family protein [Parasporobacterium sp.]